MSISAHSFTIKLTAWGDEHNKLTSPGLQRRIVGVLENEFACAVEIGTANKQHLSEDRVILPIPCTLRWHDEGKTRDLDAVRLQIYQLVRQITPEFGQFALAVAPAS